MILLTHGTSRAENPFEAAAAVFDVKQAWLDAATPQRITIAPDEPEAERAAAPTRRRAIFFTAEWCGPCRSMKSDEFPKLREHGWSIGETSSELIQLVDTDQYPNLTQTYHTTSLPTIVIVEDNKEVARLTGYHTAKQFTDKFYEGFRKTQRRSGYSGSTWTSWTFPGKTRNDLIRHLQSGQHTGKFSASQLASMTWDELNQLHADDHMGQVVWKQLRACPPGRK